MDKCSLELQDVSFISNVVIIYFVNVSEIGDDVTKGGSRNANFLGDELFILLKKEMLSNKKEDMRWKVI